MSSKIIIFGDSFADPASGGKYESEEDENFMAWYELLSKKYQIKNFGKAGTGPHYSFKKYYSFITNKRNQFRDYICIFFLSGEDRINFYGAPKVSNNINWDFVEKKSSWSVAENLEKEEKFYENFKSEIDFFYLTNHDELQWSNIKNLGFLQLFHSLPDVKFFIMFKSRDDVELVNTSIFNSENFYVLNFSLSRIKHPDDFVGHFYVNHLCEKNHQSLENLFKNFLDKDMKKCDFLFHYNKNEIYIYD